jgi:hypothetical protein
VLFREPGGEARKTLIFRFTNYLDIDNIEAVAVDIGI